MNQADIRIHNHLTGETRYIDDISIPADSLVGCIVHTPYAHADILSIDVSKALKVDGVAAIISAKDIPGINDMGAVLHDEPILADNLCSYFGQAVVLIAAKNKETAEKAKNLIDIKYHELDPLLDVEKSFEIGNFPFDPFHLKKGNIDSGYAKSKHIIEGRLEIGGQEHYYLETQSAIAFSGDDGSILVKGSTQNPSEAQVLIAKSLNIDSAKVEVETGRIGGGFGGKETQGNWCAIWASLLTYHTGKCVKIVLSREEDMVMTGKRHPVLLTYKAGFDEKGIITAYKARFLFNIGFSADLSRSIMERCLLHCENAYYIPALEIDIYPCRTNTASNCAFRGFGAPQGILGIENVMEKIASVIGKDSLYIRKINFYGIRKRNITPYGQKVTDNALADISKKLSITSEYKERVKEIKQFNKKHKWIKRGISAVPVKFGISFTTSHLNQGAALVNLYKDGSVIIHQGGIEMGQGLYDKIMLVASNALGIDQEKIYIHTTNTSIIPNTSPTAASTGSDINGQAVAIAIEKLKKRLNRFAATIFEAPPTYAYIWHDGLISCKESGQTISLKELINKAYLNRINLSEKAFYRTPGLFFDKISCQGEPFYYFVYGLSVTEVELDILTGTHTILRSDILHDTGISINQAIDKGQIEGAYIQACGWCSIEELIWNNKGKPISSNPDYYKIPGIADIPKKFNVSLYQNNPFRMGIQNSRAVGEPPFIYGISLLLSIRNAISDATGTKNFDLNLPATKENILKTIDKLTKLQHE
ncbi:MAG: xanthine dehydrogenase molybdopterin binding subunit [Bacteroidales bacterium]|nr:xanthine dehydrogenase molybdopterin binding subunit [Bacteroidales bacterium]